MSTPNLIDNEDEEEYGDPIPCCFGEYAPGSEECDWCAFADECAMEA